MMKDWTDIIGEELGNVEEPLPAEDWSVLQHKYAASRSKRKVAFFAWTGGIVSVAAAVALVLMLFRPDSSSVIPDPTGDLNDLVADRMPPVEEVVPVDAVSTETPSETVVPKKQRQVPSAVNVVKPSDDVLTAQDETGKKDETPAEANELDVVKDTVSVTERLLADAGNTNDKMETGEDDLFFDDFPEDEQKRKRLKVSVGLSGSASVSPILRIYDVNIDLPNGGTTGPGQKDSTEVDSPEPARMMRSARSYTDKYRHEIPMSFGVSARFHLSDRLSINTGLNYTRYASERIRVFSDYSYQNDRQQAHYLGIPVRLDWTIVNRKLFNFYIGAGVQADKCIYATVGGERLREKEVLFALNAAMGIQFNIVPMVGLYFEPDFSYGLNEGSIKTYRSREPFVVTVRGGLRFNF